MIQLKYHKFYYKSLIFVQTGLLISYQTVHISNLLVFAGKTSKNLYLLLFDYLLLLTMQ